jgi:uncharacterized LabA/DUF88 family protein
MALNITPRRTSAAQTTTAVADAPQPDATDQPAEATASRATTRSRRSPRSRSAPARSTSRSRQSESESDESEIPAEANASAAPAKSTSTRNTPTRRKQQGDSDEPEKQASSTSRGRSRSAARADSADGERQSGSQTDELERQRRTIDRLTRDVDELKKLQRELLDRVDGGSHGSAVQRVGVFVDVANVELAADKLSRRLDWAKVLKRLTKDRLLVRAVAYSPVHEDMNVSLESQRFTEPFVDRGFRLVTKPLKKFSDGTVKANVDIEMAVEILGMIERLDVVCLVSGDGDFEPLVRTVQSRGVRVEIVSIGNATAMALKRAGDRFIDLATILSEVGV